MTLLGKLPNRRIEVEEEPSLRNVAVKERIASVIFAIRSNKTFNQPKDLVDDLLTEFVAECHENLQLLEQHLNAWETPPSPEALGEMFRSIHTIKGSAGFLALPKLEAVTQAAEGLLGNLRGGTLSMNAEIATALSETAAAARQILGHIEANGEEGDEDYSELIAKLKKLSGI